MAEFLYILLWINGSHRSYGEVTYRSAAAGARRVVSGYIKTGRE
jgi:hypothetical protein